ncbi:glycosyltransferase [Verrucomicrobiota bacterium]
MKAGSRRCDAALLTSSLRGGGAERVMVNLANGMAARGYGVDFVLGRAHGPYLPEVSPRVDLVDFRTRRALVGTFRLLRYLLARRPPVVLASSVMCNVAVLLLRRLCRLSTRVVVRVDVVMSKGSPLLNRDHMRCSASMRRVFAAVPRLYPLADAVIAVSEGVARDLADNFNVPRERILTIYNPVITPAILKKAGEPPDHPWFAEDRPVVLAVGRLDRQKDYLTLLDAFAGVRAQRDARLLILGEGPERKRLEARIFELRLGDDVQMPGFVENPFACMKRARVFVLSSAWEGLGNCLVEAMACGCPVVSTDCPSGPAEILDNGRYGHLAEVGSSPQLAEAIVEVLDGRGRAAPSSWLQRFSLDPAVEQHIAALGLKHRDEAKACSSRD